MNLEGGSESLYELHYPLTRWPLTHHIPDPRIPQQTQKSKILSETFAQFTHGFVQGFTSVY